VAPELRGRGVATKLLGKILQKLPAFKVEKVYLEVSEKNCPAISLYQKAGFTNIGCRANYYDDGFTKALVFTVDLHR
jgi:ribosomal-protein-alanine N-acetyltransferase